MGEGPLQLALELCCGAPERAAAAAELAAPGAEARARRIRDVLRELAHPEQEEHRQLLALGPGLAARSGALRLTAGSVREGARRALLAGEPALLLRVEPDAAAALARLAAAFGLDPTDPLEATRTENDVLVANGRRAGREAVAHLACEPSVFGQMERHARVLEELRAEAGAPGLHGLVAETLAFERTAERALLVQSRLPGAPALLEGLAEGELARLLELALVPLIALHRAGAPLKAGPDAELVQEHLPRLPALHPELRAELGPALAALAQWRERARLPAVRAHGDYWLGNLLFAGAPPALAGIIDWDRSRSGALPGLDALQLGATSVARRSGIEAGEVLAELYEPFPRHPPFGRHLASVESSFRMDRETLRHVGLALFLGWLWTAHEEGGSPGPHWLTANVRRPAAAAAGWLRRRAKHEGSGPEEAARA